MTKIKTERLLIRSLNESDQDLFVTLQTSAEVREFLGGTVSNETALEKFKRCLNTDHPEYHFTVIFESVGIGIISLDRHHNEVDIEVSYQFHPDYWGKGFAKEAVTWVLEYACNELKFEKIIAETQLKNESSIRLLQSLGMVEFDRIVRFGEEQGLYALSSDNSSRSSN
jgi:ribosomal-protein-alanine N-acetyltransferase